MSNQVWHLFLRAAQYLGIYTINQEVRAKQQGRMWTLSKKFTNVGAGATINIVLEANDFDMDYIVALKTSASCNYKTYLNPTYTGGTISEVFNRVTGHVGAFPNKILLSPSVSIKGVQRADDIVQGATTGSVKLGGTSGDSIYTEISKGDKMLIEITNTSAQAQEVIQIVCNMFKVEKGV